MNNYIKLLAGKTLVSFLFFDDRDRPWTMTRINIARKEVAKIARGRAVIYRLPDWYDDATRVERDKLDELGTVLPCPEGHHLDGRGPGGEQTGICCRCSGQI